MKKIIVALLMMLLISGCSSAAAGSAGNAPVPQREDEVNMTDSIVDPAESVYEGWTIGEAPVENNVTDTTVTIGPENNQNPVTQQTQEEENFDVSKLNFEDFDELYGQLMYEGLPEDRVHIPLGNANGIWRYELIIRRDNSVDGYVFKELGYAKMNVHDSDDPPVSIVLHPRIASNDIEVWEESDEGVGYEPFGGGLDENNIIKLSGNDCILELKEYYAYEGREYLTATLWLSEDSFGDFMMIRGQE
jgi:hypothetical protein